MNRSIKAIVSGYLLLIATAAWSATPANPTTAAATAINLFGMDLLRKTTPANTNALLSPYSIQMALAMAYAGADGVTRDEMNRVLHFPTNDDETHRSFAVLQSWIGGVMQRSQQVVKQIGNATNAGDPIVLTVENRLFGQQGFGFRSSFLDCLNTNYHAPLLEMDLMKNPAAAAKQVNAWMAVQTKDRIRNLIPSGGLDADTRLVLVDAIYLKAPWETPFYKPDTKPAPFHLAGGSAVDVPMMHMERQFGYARFNDFTVITIPYRGSELQFVILLPDATNKLAMLEKRLTKLEACANVATREVALTLPKFKMTPPTLELKGVLEEMGMKTAFEAGANFDRMSNRALFISDVFHRTFLSLDEEGTEAVAATVEEAVAIGVSLPPPEPVEVVVDRPFFFAIQHRASGACLFIGQVADPR